MRMPADLGRLREARQWAGDIATELGFSDDDCFAVRLAVSEGVANAIIHGSGSRCDCIRLDALHEDGALAIEVRDRGTKASASSVDRVAEGGRGLDLVALMMDEMQLTRTDAGSVLRFVKRQG